MPAFDSPSPDPPAQVQQIEGGSFDLQRLDSSPDLLLRSGITPRCQAANGPEIIVCAPDPERNRLRPLPDGYAGDEGLPRAATDIGAGATLDLHLDSATMPDGTTSNRIMAGVKVAF